MPADLYNTISIPTLVYFYGGGFCLDLFDFQKGACANIANNASCQVIMISPPLAPEYSAQEIIGACYDSVNYLYINAKKYNIDKSNFMLSGCSSGGTIAALVTNLASNRSDFVVSQQILISPLVDLSLETHNSNPLIGFQKKDLMLTDEGLRYFVNSFLHKDSDGGKSSKVSPIYDLSKSQLKHTLTTIIVGEYDALRGDGATYASHAQELGFPTELITLDGQTHNFLSCRKVLNDGIDPALMAANKIKDNLVINPLPLRCKL
jgi:acetyl esterase